MKDTDNAPVLRLRTPDDMLGAIPALLGFKPADALVAVGVKEGFLHVTARLDLGALARPEVPDWLAGRLGGMQVFLAAYGEPRRARAGLGVMADRLGGALLDAVVVGDDRWWFWDELDAGGPIAAPSGEAEEALLEAMLDGLDLLTDDDAGRGRLVLTLMDDWRSGAPLADAQLLAAGAAMASPGARDVVWRALTPDRARDHLPFWVAVLARTPRQLRGVPLGVTGLVAWLAGDEATMDACREEGRDGEPDHPLLRLLDAVAASGLPPDGWEAILEGARA